MPCPPPLPADRLADIIWRNAPNSRRQTLTLRLGDDRPINETQVFTGDWWSGLYVEVEWQGKGDWEWRIWTPLLRATGSCADSGYGFATSAKAKAAAIRVLQDMAVVSKDEKAALRRMIAIDDPVREAPEETAPRPTAGPDTAVPADRAEKIAYEISRLDRVTLPNGIAVCRYEDFGTVPYRVQAHNKYDALEIGLAVADFLCFSENNTIGDWSASRRNRALMVAAIMRRYDEDEFISAQERAELYVSIGGHIWDAWAAAEAEAKRA